MLLQFPKHSSSLCWDLAPSAPSHHGSATQASWLSSEVTSLRKLLWASELIILCIFLALVQYIAMIFLRVCLPQKAMSFLRWAPCDFSSAQHGNRASVNAQRLKPKSWAPNLYKFCLKHMWDYWLVRQWVSRLFLKNDRLNKEEARLLQHSILWGYFSALTLPYRTKSSSESCGQSTAWLPTFGLLWHSLAVTNPGPLLNPSEPRFLRL